MKNTHRSIRALTKQNLIKKDELSSLENVTDSFLFSITEHMLTHIDPNNPDDPIRKQFIPSKQELEESPLEREDPTGDHVHTTVKGIIHRYPDRCLFMPVHVCPVYCRFCFRKEKVGDTKKTLSPEELDTAFQYIEDHPEIWEVIFSGGDPFILKPVMLKQYVERLETIPHVDIIRFHTRVPVVDPARVNEEMIRALRSKKTVYVILHANHPNEFTKEAVTACKNLVDAGIPMLSQSVLLKGINDNIETLSTLMRCFIKNRIKPYYLHHGDLVKGTKHFRTSIKTGQKLMKELRKKFSGLCQPAYMLDIPGGYGKIPIHSQYIQLENNNQYCVEDHQGRVHAYLDEL